MRFKRRGSVIRLGVLTSLAGWRVGILHTPVYTFLPRREKKKRQTIGLICGSFLSSCCLCPAAFCFFPGMQMRCTSAKSQKRASLLLGIITKNINIFAACIAIEIWKRCGRWKWDNRIEFAMRRQRKNESQSKPCMRLRSVLHQLYTKTHRRVIGPNVKKKQNKNRVQ